MLIDEENVVLEAGIQMRLEAQVDDDWVVVTVDVSVDTVEAFEHLPEEAWECFWEGDAWEGKRVSINRLYMIEGSLPVLLGNICSLSMLLCTQLIRCSIYSGADIFVGRL